MFDCVRHQTKLVQLFIEILGFQAPPELLEFIPDLREGAQMQIRHLLLRSAGARLSPLVGPEQVRHAPLPEMIKSCDRHLHDAAFRELQVLPVLVFLVRFREGFP